MARIAPELNQHLEGFPRGLKAEKMAGQQNVAS
jgi:hypothetical protein